MSEIPDLLDRRQRVVAAILLGAIDLPAELTAVSRLWLEAAKVCPGISIDEMLTGQGRRAALERARGLIDELLAEVSNTTPGIGQTAPASAAPGPGTPSQPGPGDERGLEHEMTAAQAKALLGATSLSRAIRLEILEQYRGNHGGFALVELFADFIGLANQVVANNREMIDLILCCEGMHPHDAEKANLPTIFGALNGVVLADGIDPAPLCPGCAFRQGTAANQSPSTTCDADFCGEPGEEPFMCHMDLDDRGQPTRGCAGFAQLRARRKREGDA